MSIYIVGFSGYVDDVKVGRTTDFGRRISDHIYDHGKLDYVDVYESTTADDKVVERHILDTFRVRPSEMPFRKQQRAGWTEFVSKDKIGGIENYLLEQGYVKREDCSVSDFDHVPVGNQFKARLSKLESAVTVLTIVDGIILTCLMAGKRIPNTIEEFDNIANEAGLEGAGCFDEFDLEAAKLFGSRYPLGVLQPSGEMYLD